MRQIAVHYLFSNVDAHSAQDASRTKAQSYSSRQLTGYGHSSLLRRESAGVLGWKVGLGVAHSYLWHTPEQIYGRNTIARERFRP